MGQNEAINREELSERLDGDFELFRELAALFFDDSASLIDKIRVCIEADDMEGLRKNSHTLKGAVSNFSAQGAYDASYELEMAGKNSDRSNMAEKLDRLRNEINLVIADMKSMIDKGSF